MSQSHSKAELGVRPCSPNCKHNTLPETKTVLEREGTRSSNIFIRRGRKAVQGRRRGWKTSYILPTPKLWKSLTSIPHGSESGMLPEGVGKRPGRRVAQNYSNPLSWTQWCHLPCPLFPISVLNPPVMHILLGWIGCGPWGLSTLLYLPP